VSQGRYPLLFTPIRLGRLALQNRVVMSPMGTFGLCSPDGFSTEQHRVHYEARARAGVGLIKTEGIVVHPAGKSFAPALMLDHDRYVPGLAALVREVKRHGAAIIAQLHHGGRAATSALIGRPPMAPSAVAGPRHPEVPRPMSLAEIEEIVEAFGRAAQRAREAGFDGVELQMGASYLLLGFLSPAQNRRQDEYGGDLSGRLRLPLRIVDRIRELVGPDYPIGARIPTVEYEDGGIDLAQGLLVARRLERAGLAYLDAYVGFGHRQAADSTILMGSGEAGLADLAAAVKAVVSVPVMTAGRFLSLGTAEAALAAGKADLVAFARALLADPDLVPKSLRGAEARVVPCIACEACRTAVEGVRCVLEAETDELGRAPRRADRSRRVLVQGAGLPGLTVARIARRRGHAVTVATGGLPFGGLLALRARVPGAAELAKAVEYYRDLLTDLGVDVVSTVALEGFDVVVDAGPGAPLLPFVPGLDADRVVTVEDVLAGRVAAERLGRTVGVMGAGLFAGEAALFLADAGKEVTLLALDEPPMADAHPLVAGATRLGLARRGARVFSGVRVLGVKTGGHLSVEVGDPGGVVGPFDDIVTAFGWCPPAATPGRETAGDAWEAQSLLRATRAAGRLGRAL